MRLTAVYKKTPEGYVGFVEELPGANTQAATIEEARQSLSEAVQLIVETNRELSEDQIKGQNFFKEELQVAA
jgi:predicted RNase H-like HicB family nuclease